MNAQAYILIGLGFSVFALLAVLLWAGRPEAAARRRLKRSSPSNDVLREWASRPPKLRLTHEELKEQAARYPMPEEWLDETP